MSVKNINSLKYFLDRWETVDPEYNYTVPYHESIDPNFTSLPTFVAEFKNCLVNSLPVLVTEDRHMVTEHVWPMLDRYKRKGKKHHGLWDTWGEEINIKMPPVTKQFDETNKYVWLPIDKHSTGNPWHIWIDVISKFRLMEKDGQPTSRNTSTYLPIPVHTLTW
jgi:hypothetical protein